MDWKNLSGWLKGGIIGGVGYIVIMLIAIGSAAIGVEFLTGIAIFLNFPSLFVLGIGLDNSNHSMVRLLLACLISIILWFLIGALIGKIKSRKGVKK